MWIDFVLMSRENVLIRSDLKLLIFLMIKQQRNYLLSQ